MPSSRISTRGSGRGPFFYGSANPLVEVFVGPMNLTTFLNDVDFDADMPDGSYGGTVIPEGSRNATMSHYAGRILKRYGNTEEAHAHFLEYAQNCDPPLDTHELDTIWRSALRFYGKIAGQEDYIPPEKYNQELALQPQDYSDVGQAIVLTREYCGRLRYSPSTDYLVYNGSFWEESKPKSQAVAQGSRPPGWKKRKPRSKGDRGDDEERRVELLASMGSKKATAAMNPAQMRSFRKYEVAVTYRNYAIKRRDSKYITSALKEQAYAGDRPARVGRG